MITFYYKKERTIMLEDFKKTISDNNYTKLGGVDLKISALYKEIMTPSLLGGPNIILMENFDIVDDKKFTNQDYSLLKKIAEDEYNQLHIIMNKPLNVLSRLVQNLQTHYTYITSSGDNIFDEIRDYCLKYDINIQNTLLHTLIEFYNEDYNLLTNELSKLACSNEHRVVDDNIINEFGSVTVSLNDFLLFDYILARDVEAVENHIKEYRATGQELNKLFFSFRAHVSICLQVKILAQSMSLNSIASFLHLNPWRVKNIAKSNSKISIFALMSLVKKIADIDYKIKTSSADIELLILGLVTY